MNMDELKCVDCGILPPETESAYTLIGGKAGWRLTRQRGSDGMVVAQWRCPDCWQKYKKTSGTATLAGANTAPARSGLGGAKHESITPGTPRRRS
jgi:hypothetical protein